MGRKQYYVYIMINKMNTVIYTGVTSGLRRRVYEHKEKLVGDSPRNTTWLNLYIMRHLIALNMPFAGKSKSLRGRDRRQ
jgi:predicted GIY-YIG superfamily endonuclease